MVRRSSFWVGVFVLGIFSLSAWPVMVHAVQPRTTHSAPSVAIGRRDAATTPSHKLSSQTKQITFWQAIPHALPIPDLSATPREGPAPLAVVFDNLSTGATDYLWSFGDGGTSTAFEPTYSYDTPGVYTVTLTASNLTATVSITFSHYITVYDYLRVAATRPQNAALIEPVAETVVVTLTKAVDTSTIGPHTFAVRGQYFGLYPGVYTTGELSAAFTPDLPFGPGEKLLATASRGIHAADGSYLVPHSWNFRAGVAVSGGYFTATPPWSPTRNMDVALGDLDGDGDLDAFFAGHLVANRVWFNDGQGEFIDSGQRLQNKGSRGVALGDLDGDGDLDAFVANDDFWQGRPGHEVWLNDGQGTMLSNGQSLGTGSGMDVALGDLDGDGDLDAFVAMGHTLNQPDRVWWNDGTGHFVDSGQLLGNLHSYRVAVGDLDGDGDLDAFTAGQTLIMPGVGNRIWLNDGTGHFVDSGQRPGNTASIAIDLGDVDGDGDLDVFLGNSNWPPNEHEVWLNDGRGVFTDTGQNLGISHGFFGALLLDLDGDTDLDLFVGNQTSRASGVQKAVWLNDGSGYYTLSQNLGISSCLGAASGDVNGDGDLDVVEADLDVDMGVTWLNGDVPLAGLAAVNDSPTTLGMSTTLTASVAAGTSPTYTWAFGDGEVGSGAVLAHVYPAPGLYTATVTAANHVSVLTATTVVLVEAAVTGLAAVNDSPTALGTPTTLTATVSAGTSPTYTWAFGDGEGGSGPVLAHVYPAPGLYTATVTAANHVSALTATTVVLVEEAVAGLAAVNDSPTALGTPTTLTASVAAGTSPTYTWAFGDGEVGSGAVLAHVYPAPGLYTATVTAANHVSALTATTVVLVEEAVTGLAAVNDSPTTLGTATTLTATV
ncbi:MAG: PKD domain-containing protein, partial [Anaerolineae bacterium]|nr:PKD domain-containing protein [Anaerolineae bacterium]